MEPAQILVSTIELFRKSQLVGGIVFAEAEGVDSLFRDPLR